MNYMRKIKIYLKYFLAPLLLIFISAVLWFYIPDNLSNFKVGLLASILGIGISISIVEGMKGLNEHKRIKKTFGFIKLITIPYLKNQSENFLDTMKNYQDICSLTKAQSLLFLVANFDSASLNFDKSWLQLVYSQDFIDAIKSDNQFNKISNAILEILLFTKMLTAQSINAKHLLANDPSKFSEIDKNNFLSKTKKIRDDINENMQKLKKYTEKLEEEIDIYFSLNSIIHKEFER